MTRLTTSSLPPDSQIAEWRLDNGTRLLSAEVPSARQMRLVAAVGAGHLDEPAAWPGLAHLLEHALFQGSRQYPEPGQFAAWINERGGRYNAHTGEYATDVHLCLPVDAAEAGLERLVELMTSPTLAIERVIDEIEVIEAEFRARLADPRLHREVALARLCQPGHPAANCHHGHRCSLTGDTAHLHRALLDFHAGHYRAERMSLVMLGPMPLAQQREWLTAAAARLPSGAEALVSQSSRWAAPARIQWAPPAEACRAPAVLELLWPLPEPLPSSWREDAEGLVATLANGALAATLQRHDTIRALDAELRTDTSASLLALTLLLTSKGQRQVEPVLATCQAQVIALAKAGVHRPRPAPHDTELEEWAKRAARCLALGLPERVEAPSAPLADWLRPAQCRVLEAVEILGKDHEVNQDTGTRLRYLATPLGNAAPWSICSAPHIAAHTSASSQAVEADGSLAATTALTASSEEPMLWWGDGPSTPGGFLGLAWPAPETHRAVRLAHWHKRTLALRQAAAAHGLKLLLGGDGRGDWVIAWGDAERLESALAQALRAWPRRSDDLGPAPLDETGLLAQRLLTRLENAPLPPQAPRPRRLAWAGGSLDRDTVEAVCHRLFSTLPEFTHHHGNDTPSAPPAALADWPTQWLSPQGEDNALMLLIDAPDASATSRVLFQLLTQCHDAAFQHALRQRQGLGYAVAVRYREAGGWPRLGYVVQSHRADIPTLRRAVADFLTQQGEGLARLDEAGFTRRCHALTEALSGPETSSDTLRLGWQALRHGADSPAPWQAYRQAALGLEPGQLAELAGRLASGRLSGEWWAHAPAGRRWS